jgi:hypothetical protein
MVAKTKSKQSLSDEDKSDLVPFLQAIEVMREVDPTMPLHKLVGLLLVALNEGDVGVKQYAKQAEVATSVMTRNLLDLGQRTRAMEPGLGLVRQGNDPMDLRTTQTFLTDSSAHQGAGGLRRADREALWPPWSATG